jgi:sugar fermentation stimulation protein A
MRFDPPLTPARLIKRYKRFLADAVLENGEIITTSCPNTGSMLGLAEPGMQIFISHSDKLSRKYAWAWQATERPDVGLVGINTSIPNRIVEDAIGAGSLPEFRGYSSIRREVVYGENSRIDLLLEEPATPRCFVEIKNVTLFRQPGLAEFPDCVTARGAKHLRELARMAEQGHRAVMVYLIQCRAAERFALAGDLDRAYLTAYREARRKGVEAMAPTCRVSTTEIEIARAIPVLDPR